MAKTKGFNISKHVPFETANETCRRTLVALQRSCGDGELFCLLLLSPVRFFCVKQAFDDFKARLKPSLCMAHAQRQIFFQISTANIAAPDIIRQKSSLTPSRCLFYVAMTAKVA